MAEHFHYINLDQLIAGVIRGYYIRYDRLEVLINTEFKGSDASSVDIYIDLMDIFCKVDKAINNNSLALENPLVITSAIINLVAHYRNFFLTRYFCTSRFWIINSIGNTLSSKYYKDYKYPALSPMMENLYKLNVETLQLLCKYIVDIQYEEASIEFVTKALAIASYEAKAKGNIMDGVNNSNTVKIAISKDIFTFQLCAFPKFYVMVPRKVKGQDMSYIVNYSNAVSFYFTKLKNEYVYCNFPANYLLPLMALTKVPTRGIPTKYQYGSVLSKVQSPEFIAKSPSYPSNFADTYIAMFVKKNREQDKFEVECRMKACDAGITQLYAYELTVEYHTYSGIVNLYDPDSVKVINEQYFKSCALDLIVL